MRLAALLLLAAFGGFLLGRLTVPEAGGLRGPARTPSAVPEPREPPSVPRAHEPAPAPAEPATAATSVVQPTGPIPHAEDDEEEVDPDAGAIEVDFDGFDGDPHAWTGWKTMRGGYEEYEAYAEEGETVARFEELDPGVYDVWWLDALGRRRGSRAAVEGGKRTLLRAAGCETSIPVPEGLGILDVEVTATWGGGLPCFVHILARGEEQALEMSSTGHGSTALHPGTYVLRVGDHTEEATVVEGRVTSRRMTHVKEGDLLLEMGNEMVDGLGIARAGQTPERLDIWTGTVNGIPRCGLIYLAAGEYDVVYVRDLDSLGVPLGHASVEAGHTSWLRSRLPTGGLEMCVVVPPSTQSQVCVVVEGDHRPGQMVMYEAPENRECRYTAVLAPGRYKVTASAGGCEPRTIEVDVADRMVEVNLELVPER